VDSIQGAIGDHAQQHGGLGIDVAAETAGQQNPIRPFPAEGVQEVMGGDVEGGFGQLDLAHVVLGNGDGTADFGLLFFRQNEGEAVVPPAQVGGGGVWDETAVGPN
jgi:hypothetical protein